MYLMYVDESGDCGLVNSPTRYFVLTGLVVHELRWQSCLGQVLNLRSSLRQKFGLKLREEIHASRLISHPGPLARLRKPDRLEIIRVFAKELATMPDISVLNIVVDKLGKRPDYDVFSMAWRALIQRFENTLVHRNFPGPVNADERGLLFPDHTDDKKLVKLLRQMRRYNPIPNQTTYGQGYRNLALSKIIEDPSFRDSEHSYFVQACDLAAYLLYQHLNPNSYMRKKSGHNYFTLLSPVLCKVASSKDSMGIVRL